MYSIDNPDDMTPVELLKEIAGLLAAGFLRLDRRCSYEETDSPIDAESPPYADINELSEVTGVNRIALV
jgi:hypothetical protein